MLCQYCNEKEGIYNLRNGKFCCEIKFQSCKGYRKKMGEIMSESLKKQYKNGKRTSHFKIYNDGSFWKNRKHKKETKEKLSKIFLGVKMDAEFKERRSSEMKERYVNGWECKAGRTKKINYESKFCGIVKVDGYWELNTCKFLDRNNIEWERNKKRFKYFDNDGKERTYCPDFFLLKSNTFLEVKGYETELDRLKWAQFPERLEIWKKKELVERGIIGE